MNKNFSTALSAASLDRNTYLEMIRDGKINIGGVPLRFIDKEMYKLAMDAEYGCIKYIDEFMRSDKLWSETIKFRPQSVTYLNKEKDVKKLYRMAVEVGGLDLTEIPELRQTYKICKIACKRNPKMINYVHPFFKLRTAYWMFKNELISAEEYNRIRN